MPGHEPEHRVAAAPVLVERPERGQRDQADPVAGPAVGDHRLRPGPPGQIGEQDDDVATGPLPHPGTDLQYGQRPVLVERDRFVGDPHLPGAVAGAVQGGGQLAGEPPGQLGGQAGIGDEIDDGGTGRCTHGEAR
ncbi:hypothetical protein [Pseudonocardia sp. HH130630-07]|uniref:hypothetical protein n=1 Tax=Pseudonocardia sp. HH130630-07 TaxID=1690815 RepID=UPI000815222C|nr:hypothetical protein [Pseudonocardia sp. HH130630-07]ANY05529.1 hypothetical protein AFB00_03545 [Pseudonocardia sp. HH130630-07]